MREEKPKRIDCWSLMAVMPSALLIAMAWLIFSAPAAARPANGRVIHSQSKSKAHALDSKLLKAAQIGDLASVKHLLARGTNVNAAQENGWTALMLAAQDSKTSVAKYLIEHGADVHRRSTAYNDVDAMILGVDSGNVAICRMLINHGSKANETQAGGFTLVMEAVGNGNLSPRQVYNIVKFLIEHGANPRKKDRNGNTALSIAQDRPRVLGSLSATERLLEAHGATK